jgi:hypothetical protein
MHGARRLLQIQSFAFQLVFDQATQLLCVLFDPLSRQGQLLARMVREQTCMDVTEPGSELADMRGTHAKQAAMQLQQALAVTRQSRLRTLCLQTHQQMFEALDPRL